MKLAVIGSGGREHAICYKLKQSPKIKKRDNSTESSRFVLLLNGFQVVRIVENS